MSSHPQASDVFLVVEVADKTLGFDARVKAPLYARGGIAEAWVVDVNERAIHVFRGPHESGYRDVATARSGQSVECVALPGIVIGVDELFGA